MPKFMRERGVIDRFEKSRPKRVVNFEKLRSTCFVTLPFNSRTSGSSRFSDISASFLRKPVESSNSHKIGRICLRDTAEASSHRRRSNRSIAAVLTGVFACTNRDFQPDCRKILALSLLL